MAGTGLLVAMILLIIFEAENEKEALKMSIAVSEFVATETLVAIPREEAIKLL